MYGRNSGFDPDRSEDAPLRDGFGIRYGGNGGVFGQGRHVEVRVTHGTGAVGEPPLGAGSSAPILVAATDPLRDGTERVRRVRAQPFRHGHTGLEIRQLTDGERWERIRPRGSRSVPHQLLDVRNKQPIDVIPHGLSRSATRIEPAAERPQRRSRTCDVAAADGFLRSLEVFTKTAAQNRVADPGELAAGPIDEISEHAEGDLTGGVGGGHGPTQRSELARLWPGPRCGRPWLVAA